MNLIENNANIIKMYKYQLEEIDSKNYQEYIEYLHLYFLKKHKKEKYTKEFLNGNYILIDKANPQKKIIITPAEFINIHKLYIELKEYSNVILSKISNIIESKNNITEENRQEYELLQKKYILCKDKLKDINLINKNFYDEIEILFSKKIEKTNDLAKYYQKRILSYNNISIMINENLKNTLIKKFKNNKKKIPSMTEINKIAKENMIPSIEIEKWFIWIETMYFYFLVSKEIVEINNEINIKEENFDINTKYMIIKKPILEKI